MSDTLTPEVRAAVDRANERAFWVDEACERLGFGSRSTFYAEVRAGRLEVRKIGARTVVLQSEITRYLTTLPTAGDEL
jgi:Helix-turn-helix domain